MGCCGEPTSKPALAKPGKLGAPAPTKKPAVARSTTPNKDHISRIKALAAKLISERKNPY